MPGTFIITKTPKGFYRFTLLAANNQKILTSKNYSSLQTCRDGIETITRNATTQVEDQTLKTVEKKTNPKYEVYFDKAGQYRYRLIASNGQNIAISEDGYASKAGVMNGIASVGRTVAGASIDEKTLHKN